ncbi:GNAT family N-acetyltransferase [Halobacillus litoralis]|uniref:GNAT family N-acetyltransferase n=1 Tax=Halobacillus litoralis TaxID=45668 RepID=A0A410MBN4_9BACI|nr:GNAT family N-acetyltransferase [Halobacillus litoralis]QAS52066.1 GNAT family N-acetyltransferase [Halobacillus litoralis]
MKINDRDYYHRNLRYTIRSAVENDAGPLSELRLEIDGETENLDREQGEAYINEEGFKDLIRGDTESLNHLFLIAEIDREIVGYSRCECDHLKRFSHKVEFGVGVLRAFWGNGIGRSLLKESIIWSDSNDIRKMTLRVLETNKKAISLYKEYGFEVEGTLKEDRWLSDGIYYNTLLMARLNPDRTM